MDSHAVCAIHKKLGDWLLMHFKVSFSLRQPCMTAYCKRVLMIQVLYMALQISERSFMTCGIRNANYQES